MAMIQIEQDNELMLAKAREGIARVDTAVRGGEPALDVSCWHMHTIGHLGALLTNQLLSHDMYTQLMAELDAARGPVSAPLPSDGEVPTPCA